MKALTKNDLINAVAAHGLSKRQSASVVESLFDIIFSCFEKGEDVKIVGFGHFRIRRKALASRAQPADGRQHRDHRAQGADVQAEQGAQASAQPRSRTEPAWPGRSRTSSTTGSERSRRSRRCRPTCSATGSRSSSSCGRRRTRRASASTAARTSTSCSASRRCSTSERLTLEGAKKRLLARVARHDQMDLGLRGPRSRTRSGALRERLRALRERLAAGRPSRAP